VDVSNIQAGDLVMVVRGHECALGMIFTASKIGKSGGWLCQRCKENKWESAISAFHSGETACVPLAWLKKIDPLPAERKEEIAHEAN
jgi:hypothetical protein